jgi:hypothetical protein
MQVAQTDGPLREETERVFVVAQEMQ